MLLHSPLRTPHKPWQFLCYITAGGRNDFTKWDAKLSVKARAKRDVAMRYLRVQPPERWNRPLASSLGNHLYVIHFSDENGTAHRLCGFFDLQNHAFVICVTIVEKDGKYNPQDYEKRTLDARTQVARAFAQHTAPWPWRIQ